MCAAGLASCQGRPFTRQTSHRREAEWLPETQAPDIWFSALSCSLNKGSRSLQSQTGVNEGKEVSTIGFIYLVNERERKEVQGRP